MQGITIIESSMTYSKESGYVGKVQFRAEGHQQAYEITLQSKKGNDWGYGLFFLKQSGSEEQLLAFEERLEEDDELFEFFIATAKEKLEK
ncbi:hypothetical protein [Paenibacillus sp. HB172176]|uniref:hypothetical protein n=1 Tax=Paenibacillus sp. HB172176 TaxID=2493690 RepID=UPI00143B6C44|nr:hypothetical protein [Paenibacillus sp. HB172176]